MQLLLAFLLFGTFVFAEDVQPISGYNPTYGYMTNIGIPEAERIRKVEEADSRIIGGVPAFLGQFPFQAGIITEISHGHTTLQSICGGSLISFTRVLTAAHCWFDGFFQGSRLTIVLGSIQLFIGGIRIQTSEVAMHPDFSANPLHNDVLIAYLPAVVLPSATVSPVALPAEFESFAGEDAIVVGFGTTGFTHNSLPNGLNHVRVSVIRNSQCALGYPFIYPSHICTSGFVGVCRGDYGGPLIVQRGNRYVQIGIASFGIGLHCEASFPSVYARVTSYKDFINKHLR